MNISKINQAFLASDKTKEVFIYKENEHKIEDVGNVVGVAVLFSHNEEEIKNKTDPNYRVGLIKGFVAHDYLIRRFNCGIFDDDYTKFGFITDKGYFVDRNVAAELYKKFAQDNEIKIHQQHLYSLNSYNVNWGEVFSLIKHPF